MSDHRIDRFPELLELAALVLADLVNNCELFHEAVPGEPARQFLLGVAAGIDWSLGEDVPPATQVINYARQVLLDRDPKWQHLRRHDRVQ